MTKTRIQDQNGNPVHKSVRREPDGTWSAVVWWGGGFWGAVTDVHRVYGYQTRAAAREADISESAEQTNRRVARRGAIAERGTEMTDPSRWYQSGEWRVEDLGSGKYGVYRDDGDSYVRCATVRADTPEAAIDRACEIRED